MGKSGEHAVVGQPGAAAGPSFRTPNAGGGRKARPSSGSSTGPASSSTPGGLGARVGRGAGSAAGPAARSMAAAAGCCSAGPDRPASHRIASPHTLLPCRSLSPAVPAGMPAGVRAELYGTSPSPSGPSALYGSSPSGSGRRARRNARRAAMDAGLEAAAHSPLCR